MIIGQHGFRARRLDARGVPIGDWFDPGLTFAEAVAEPPHGRVGATEAADEAVCQLYHGMSRAEWDALPEGTGDWDDD